MSFIELKEIIELYNYIYFLYKNFGKKIKFNNSFCNKMNDKFSEYLIIIEQIINIYESIEQVYNNDIIKKHKLYFINLKTNIIDLKNSVNKVINNIIKNEHLINRRISKISITKNSIINY